MSATLVVLWTLCAAALAGDNPPAPTAPVLVPAPGVVESRVVLVTQVELAETEVKASYVKSLFLGARSAWPGGTPVVPITLAAGAPSSEPFFEFVLRLPMADYQRHWQERQLSGQGMTPMVAASTEEALALVASTPGGVTYAMSSDPLPPGVHSTPIKTHD